MAISRKYSRTYHYTFSPGTTSDDRIHHHYWDQLQEWGTIVHTEKLDGENTCLNQYGVFARSHAAPTLHPWANYLKEKWHFIKNDLDDLEIFGENLYAIHSIRYEALEQHFYVFAVRQNDQWLSWEEVKFYADLLDFPVVPEIDIPIITIEKEFQSTLINAAQQHSKFQSIDAYTHQACNMEGIVSRNAEAFHVNDFSNNVFKYVRAQHVKTDVHWRRNWKRAPLIWEHAPKNR